MRRTYAYNGVIFGTLAGLMVLGLTESIVLAVLALLVVSVLAFMIIRFIENLLYKGINAAVETAQNAIEKRRSARR